MDKKINNRTIEIQKVTPEKKETIQYDIDFLKKQEAQLIEVMASEQAARQAELDEVRDLIARAEVLGIEAGADIINII